MPEISRFFGIVIKMFFDDHNPPHFHAEYGNDLALIDIRSLAVFSERIFKRQFVRRLPRNVQQRSFMQLNALDAALKLGDLRLPPSNRLEALKGNRNGQYSIRINDQWRICFVWREGHAEHVEIVDDH